MNGFRDKSAIVTGAASGIGLALSRALVARGARVWLTDIDSEAASSAAEALGTSARSLPLDVRDADAFAKIVHDVAAERGGLDFLFNNAGIVGAPGETHELSAGHFDRVSDINIRGVTNGVVAAYPLMVERGRGHIVNTASSAGLLPVPLMVPYAMSKHAVVGLSESLRLEAETHGVRVSVLCPSAIDTPLLDSEGPEDLEKPWRPDVRQYLTQLAGAPYPSDAFAEYALDCVAVNRGIIIAPRSTRIARFLSRLAPRLAEQRIRTVLRIQLDSRPTRG
ncbi:MAG: SDR family oxidoreductase [Deltaproteobacteria bacterium]|nr:SDR family oxidoreductase [Deltaproteobacteria bacterium]